ncbi:MAG TPA: hypothetical protein VIZ43_30120 [Trebonia sp.]
MRRAATHLDSATVVVDPALPREMWELLVRSGGRLVPYQGPVPEAASPAGRARGCAVLTGLFFAFAILGGAAGNLAFAFVMLMIAVTGFPLALAARPSEREIAAALLPITQHRHYVVPSTDIDAEHWQLWKRAVDARNRIAGASVVSDGHIDSVQVAEVLPERLWDIAERLARLAEVRAKHREILGDVTPDDPDVAPIVLRQREAQELVVSDVARRVDDLEKFADLVDAADLAARKESIVRELHALDDTHADLLAGIGDTVADADLASRLADDATAVIEQARRAIKQANDAALSLALPGQELPEDELRDDELSPSELAPEEPPSGDLPGDEPPSDDRSGENPPGDQPPGSQSSGGHPPGDDPDRV